MTLPEQPFEEPAADLPTDGVPTDNLALVNPDQMDLYDRQAEEDFAEIKSEILGENHEAWSADGLDEALDLVEKEGIELDPSTQQRVDATVGAGTLALASSVENSDTFIRESLMQRIKKNSKKLSAKVATLAIATGAIASWVFELGPWNESMRADIGFDVLTKSMDAAKTGLAVGAATVPIELVPAAMVAWGLSRKNMPGRNAMEWMHRKLGAGEATDKERTKLDIAKDASLALGVGAAAVVAKRFFTDKNMSLKEGLKTSAMLAPVIAAFSGGVGWGTAYGILHAEGSRFEGAAEFFKNNGTDAKFWLAIFGGLQAVDLISKKVKNNRAEKKLIKEAEHVLSSQD